MSAGLFIERGLILALSGPIGAGKTTLAHALARDIEAVVVSTREILRDRRRVDDRSSLQVLGEMLDETEGGSWVADAVLATRTVTPAQIVIVVDAVRTLNQIGALRARAAVRHIHLTASDAILSRRYEDRRRQNSSLEFDSFEDARAHDTELLVETLAGHAELVLNTGQSGVAATRDAAVEHFSLGGN